MVGMYSNSGYVDLILLGQATPSSIRQWQRRKEFPETNSGCAGIGILPDSACLAPSVHVNKKFATVLCSSRQL